MEGTQELKNSEVVNKFQLQKKSGIEYRNRRTPEWTENYLMYRDKPQVNRLTQRQSVHIPLTKYAVLSAVKDFEKLPSLYFHNLGNDKQKEVYYNEYWKETLKINKIRAKDVMDKKLAALYGRPYKKLNVIDGKVKIEIIDPLHILVDRYMDSSDIDSSQYIIQTNIWASLYELQTMEGIDPLALSQLKHYYKTEAGLVEAAKNLNEMQTEKDRNAALGLDDAYDPSVDEVYVELNEAYMMLYSNQYKREVMHACVFACTEAGEYLLKRKELCEVLGATQDDFWYTHIPFTSWAIDIESGDVLSDSIADIVRGSNKIIDAWFSQEVENRTMRNFGMNYYDSKDGKFVPQTFTPVPFGWYPIPGNPNDIVKRVEIPELNGNLEAINFVIQLAEKSVAVNSTQQGAVEKSSVTLGEIQLSLANAKERIKDTTISYVESWEDLGIKFIKILEGAANMKQIEPMEVVRPGRNNLRMYKRLISAEDWFDVNGYSVEVKTMEDKQQEDIDQLQKLQAAKQFMPNNMMLDSIVKKKMIEFAGLKPEEVDQVMQMEQENIMAMQNAIPVTDNAGAGPTPLPSLPVVNSNANQSKPVTSIA